MAATGGDQVRWGDVEHLLATLVDLDQAALWQRGGGVGSRPRPIPRPGQPEPGRRIGRARPRSEAIALLQKWRRGELEPKEA